MVPWVITGLGKILVGPSSKNKNVDLRLLGALNIPVGWVAILLPSLSIRQTSRTVSSTRIALAIAGLASTVLSTAGPVRGTLAHRPASWK